MIISSIFGSPATSQPKQQPQPTTETTTTERSDTQASSAPPASKQQTRVTEPSATSSTSTSRTTAETAPAGDQSGPGAARRSTPEGGLRADSERSLDIAAEETEAMARAWAEQARQSAQIAALIESIASVEKSFKIDAADSGAGNAKTPQAKYANAEAALRDVDPPGVSMTV